MDAVDATETEPDVIARADYKTRYVAMERGRTQWANRAKAAEEAVKQIQRENNKLIEQIGELRAALSDKDSIEEDILPPTLQPREPRKLAGDMRNWLATAFGYPPGLTLGEFEKWLRDFLSAHAGKIRESAARKVFAGKVCGGTVPIGGLGVGQVYRFNSTLLCMDILETMAWAHKHGDGASLPTSSGVKEIEVPPPAPSPVISDAPDDEQLTPIKRKRGRPKGSKNKRELPAKPEDNDAGQPVSSDSTGG